MTGQTQSAGAVWSENAQHGNGCRYYGWLPVVVQPHPEGGIAAQMPGRVTCPGCAVETQLPGPQPQRGADWIGR